MVRDVLGRHSVKKKNFEVSEGVKYFAVDESGTLRFYDKDRRMHNSDGPALVTTENEFGHFWHGIFKNGKLGE